MNQTRKLWRVKISKTVYQTVEVIAPDADKAIEAAQEHCPSLEKSPYFDGYRDETAPKASDAVESPIRAATKTPRSNGVIKRRRRTAKTNPLSPSCFFKKNKFSIDNANIGAILMVLTEKLP
jgi:hypothetical protein